MKSRQLWWYHGLHFLLALSVPLIFLVLAGCMKAKAIQEDLGPEVPTKTINDKLNAMSASADLNTLSIGQFLQYTTVRQIENSTSTITLSSRRIEVIDRKDTTDQARFTLKITDSTRRMDGKFNTITSEDALWLNKIASPPTPTPPPSSSTTGFAQVALAHAGTLAAASGTPRITFHNLRESDGTMDVPAPVAARAGCEGLSPCTLPVHFLQFSMVIWADDNQSYQKINFDFAFSLKTPYLPFGDSFNQMAGLMVVNCQSTYLPVDDRTVYVRDCEGLDDFQR